MLEVKRLLLLGLCGSCFGGLALADDAESVAESALGDGTYLEREQAKQELWARGKESQKLLDALANSDDPEVAWRARQILRWVDLEITPDTPKDIVSLIEDYLDATNAQERERIYNDLLEKEAYVQLFRLPRHISDEVVSRSLAERVAELAGQVAEEKILEGKDMEALSILEDAKDAETGNLRWVALASALGLKEQLWPDLSEEDRMRFARWEGDLDLIRKLAPATHEIQTTLQLIDGNVMPYLDKRSTSNDQQGLRARLAKSFWSGEEDSERIQKLKDDLLTALKKNGVEESPDVLVLLAQLGYAEETLPYFEDNSPLDLFEYYHGFELLDEAFDAIGLKAGEPIPDSWVEKVVDEIGAEFDLSNDGCRALISVGLFLVEKDRLTEAERLFDVLLSEMDDLGINEVNSMIAFLAGRQSATGYGGYPEYAIQAASERDEGLFEPDSFLSESFFAEESVNEFYRFLSEYDEEMDDWERVRGVFAFFGRPVEFPKEKFAEILEQFEKEAAEENSSERWDMLMQSASVRGDIPAMERAIRAMVALDNEDESSLTNLASLLFSDGRFGEAVTLLEDLLEKEPSRFDLMEYLAVTLEAAGRSEDAKEWLKMLEKLALGDGSWLTSLGGIWGELGDYQRQHELYQRAFLLLPAESSGWIRHLYILSESARMAGKWEQAAACREAYQTFLVFELGGSPRSYFLGRGHVDFSRAMAAFENGEMEKGDAILERLVGYAGHDSFFADDVFPALRRAGLHEQAERVWARVSPAYRRSMELYPKGHNTFNTAAWVASRAACDLDDAALWVEKALEGKPGSSAYLDTRAEVAFARGQREQALKMSEEACKKSEGMATLGMLRVQYRHFRDDPFPLPQEKPEPERQEEPND